MKTLRDFPSNFPSLFEQPAGGAAASKYAAVTGGTAVTGNEFVSPGEAGSAGFAVGAADAVLVSAVKGGRLAATIELTGMRDMAELLAAATAAFRHIGGLVTLRLRNRTRGLTANRVVMLGRVAMPFPFRAGGEAVSTAS